MPLSSGDKPQNAAATFVSTACHSRYWASRQSRQPARFHNLLISVHECSLVVGTLIPPSSHGQFDHLILVQIGSFRFPGFQPKRDRLLKIALDLVECLSLGTATRKRRNLRPKTTLLCLMDDRLQLHAQTLCPLPEPQGHLLFAKDLQPPRSRVSSLHFPPPSHSSGRRPVWRLNLHLSTADEMPRRSQTHTFYSRSGGISTALRRKTCVCTSLTPPSPSPIAAPPPPRTLAFFQSLPRTPLRHPPSAKRSPQGVRPRCNVLRNQQTTRGGKQPQGHTHTRSRFQSFSQSVYNGSAKTPQYEIKIVAPNPQAMKQTHLWIADCSCRSQWARNAVKRTQ